MIYLDNNATTQVDPAVAAAMLPFLTTAYGNPSSTHRFGQESRQAIEAARHQLAALVGCEVREIIFTSGGTEADNAAIHGLLAARAPRKVIVTSTVEHSAIREPLAQLAKAGGAEIVRIPVNPQGDLDLELLDKTLATRAADIALATFMFANNETGVIFDIPAIGQLCRRHQVPLHVDAVQAIGKMPFHFKTLPIEVLSLSAHKFHGPKGIGALVVRRGTRWQPFIRGGPQELDRRGGTENVPAIVGTGHAAALAKTHLADGTWARMAALRDQLEQGILRHIPNTHVIGGGNRPEHRIPNTTNIAFAHLEAEAILLLLSERDLCASAGAACSSGSLEPSPVIQAMHIDSAIAHGAVRFSLSRFTTEEEIDRALAIIPPVIDKLRQTLPLS